MLHKIIGNLNVEQKKELNEYLNKNDVEGSLDVLAYIASNTAAPYHGPTLGVTWKGVEKDIVDNFGKNVHVYGAIMGGSNKVPGAVVEERKKLNLIGGDLVFDFVVYKK